MYAVSQTMTGRTATDVKDGQTERRSTQFAFL